MRTRYQTLATLSVAGDLKAIHTLMADYAANQRWSKHTFRVRLDGIRALVRWWNTLSLQPPIGCLTHEDAKRFLEANSQLCRCTLSTYIKGIRAFIRALQWARKEKRGRFWPGLTIPKKFRNAEELDLTHVRARLRPRLIALQALQNCGLSVPQSCSLTWNDIRLNQAEVMVKGQTYRLNVTAVRAISALPNREPTTRAIDWQPDTARGWIRQCRRAKNSKPT